MKTTTISKKFLKEKELIIVPRREYEKLLKQSEQIDGVLEKRLWQKSSADNFLKMYDNLRDSVYDRL